MGAVREMSSREKAAVVVELADKVAEANRLVKILRESNVDVAVSVDAAGYITVLVKTGIGAWKALKP